MKIVILCLTAAVTFLFLACGAKLETSSTVNAAASPVASTAAAAYPAAEPMSTATPDGKAAKSTCGPVSEAGKKFIKDQSFPFDYEPFRGSCFVTFGDLKEMMDEKDHPRGSTFHIYKDGKQVFEFPYGFRAQHGVCWVEAVAFDDLNGDARTDVIVAGLCLGARDTYQGNIVYVNTGSTFKTNIDANDELIEAKSIAAIKKAVKQNLKRFF